MSVLCPASKVLWPSVMALTAAVLHMHPVSSHTVSLSLCLFFLLLSFIRVCAQTHTHTISSRHTSVYIDLHACLKERFLRKKEWERRYHLCFIVLRGLGLFLRCSPRRWETGNKRRERDRGRERGRKAVRAMGQPKWSLMRDRLTAKESPQPINNSSFLLHTPPPPLMLHCTAFISFKQSTVIT